MKKFFVDNRRDGARIISSGLLVFTIAATQLQHVLGQVICAFSAMLSIYWGLAYRRLEH